MLENITQAHEINEFKIMSFWPFGRPEPASNSNIHISVPILFQILLPFRLLNNVEQSSLSYTIGPCWSSFLNIAVVFEK